MFEIVVQLTLSVHQQQSPFAPARTARVDSGRGRLPGQSPAALAQPQTQIGILEVEEECRIEAADLLESRSPDQHAGSRIPPITAHPAQDPFDDAMIEGHTLERITQPLYRLAHQGSVRRPNELRLAIGSNDPRSHKADSGVGFKPLPQQLEAARFEPGIVVQQQ